MSARITPNEDEPRRLGHGFEHHDAGKDREGRKMILEIFLGSGEGFLSDDGVVRNLDHIVNHSKLHGRESIPTEAGVILEGMAGDGQIAEQKSSPDGRGGLSYASAGVSIQEGDRFTSGLQSLMRRTFGARVIENPGGFAGLFRLDYNEKLFQRNYKDPVLVACCDGVGTKVKLALEAGRAGGLGLDLVAMSVNDLVVQGAEPLFFLDYIAFNKVDPDALRAIVESVAEGCKQAGAALLGGETAEMPGVYAPGDLDLAGFAVGVVELKRATDTSRVEAGDIVLGLESNGVHSNGFTLVRAIVERAGLELDRVYPKLDAERSLGEMLLTPTRIYADPVVRLLREYRVKKIVSGMAHITGGGLAGNLKRAIHNEVDATLKRSAWQAPPIFHFLQEAGAVDNAEMERVFNMGIGYCLIVRPTFADSIARKLSRRGERVCTLGEIVPGRGEVCFR